MSRTSVLLTAVLLLASASIPLAVTAEPNEPRDPPNVKIGFLVPLTGPIAVYGPGFQAAGNIAEEHINAMQNQYNFEIVEADSACDGNQGATGAQVLVDAGVVAVAGAACSGATMGANSVLSAAGITQVAYASTNPGLSDSNAYPMFFRVVRSDALPGHALAGALNSTGGTNPAVLYAQSDYGAGLADAFEDAWGTWNLCETIPYSQTDTDFHSEVQQVLDSGCDSVVLIPYGTGEAMPLIDELDDHGFSGSIVCGEGCGGLEDETDNPAALDGVLTVRDGQPIQTNVSITFDADCTASSECSGGIYTEHAYDSIRLIAEAFIDYASSGGTLAQSIYETGQMWEGATGYISFAPNGDSVTNGLDICEYTYDGTVNFSCDEVWYPNWYNPAPTDNDDDSWTNSQEAECGTDPNDPDSIPLDTDNDGTCNQLDEDDDGDGYDDIIESFSGSDPLDQDSLPPDYDSDGIPDIMDYDIDGDGWNNLAESVCLGPGIYPQMNHNLTPSDYDGDGRCDIVSDSDLDHPQADSFLDYDGDNDGVPDSEDAFPFDESESLDTDSDGTGNNADVDDDGDFWSDTEEAECGYDSLDPSSTPPDTDSDGECDELDTDDDGDTVPDQDDAFPLDDNEWSDNDLDGVGDNSDNDDDNDEWTDVEENECETDSHDSSSIPSDYDSDGICDLVDEDDDNDGFPDQLDDFPMNADEWLDSDQDGVGDNQDEDDDGDQISDEAEIQMGTDPLNHDTDGDGHYDAVDDLPLDSTEWRDTDGDGVGDNSDAFPSIARYQTGNELFMDLILVGFAIFMVVSLIGGYRFGGSRDDKDP